MKFLLVCFCVTLALGLTLAGCSKAPDPAKQSGDLDKILQALAASAPAVAPLASQASEAVRANDLVRAATLLHSAKQHPQLNPEQRLAVQEAMRAISGQLTERALRGDEKARADLAAIEKVTSR